MKMTAIAIILLTFTTGCAIPKKPMNKEPVAPTEFSVTLTPDELTKVFEIQDSKVTAQLDQLRKDFLEVSKRIETLRNQISKQVRDCLCPGEMK